MIIKIFLGVMTVFALLAVQTHQLRRAVIYLGVFSLINSFAYVFYGAPDVSLAEAIIGSTLVTVLYLIALKKYKPLPTRYTITTHYTYRQNTFSIIKVFGKSRKLVLAGFCAVIAFLTLSTYINTIELTGTPAWDYYVKFFKQDTGANNAVTAIYLNYRVFDTLFEALLLLISVIAVIYFSWRSEG
ncbi:MAG: DUF4040 domain-containing protein [Firmicutes bacterium]|nr:DUF4040 domain-containing protein [Bacillota bacterium]